MALEEKSPKKLNFILNWTTACHRNFAETFLSKTDQETLMKALSDLLYDLFL